MKRPVWLDQDPHQWPASARIAYGILLRATLRRMKQHAPQPKVAPECSLAPTPTDIG